MFRGGVEFEAQRSAGVRGCKPNLDLVAEPAAGDWLFVESECLEYLRPHRTPFSEAFVGNASKVLSPEIAAVYADSPTATRRVRTGTSCSTQPSCSSNFLAAKIASGSGHKLTLAYLYWEPADAAAHEAFGAHCDEAGKLAGALADDHVRLGALSYRDVWAQWDQFNDAEFAAHAAALRPQTT